MHKMCLLSPWDRAHLPSYMTQARICSLSLRVYMKWYSQSRRQLVQFLWVSPIYALIVDKLLKGRHASASWHFWLVFSFLPTYELSCLCESTNRSLGCRACLYSHITIDADIFLPWAECVSLNIFVFTRASMMYAKHMLTQDKTYEDITKNPNAHKYLLAYL